MAQETPRKKRGKRAELAEWLDRVRPSEIGEAELEQLRGELAPISESYMRKLLRESGAALSPIVEGVRQGTFDELEMSLLALLDEYMRSEAPRRAAVRRLVIQARERARWAAKREEKRSEKEEMDLWMLTWLENPPVFPEWIKLRRARLAANDNALTRRA